LVSQPGPEPVLEAYRLLLEDQAKGKIVTRPLAAWAASAATIKKRAPPAKSKPSASIWTEPAYYARLKRDYAEMDARDAAEGTGWTLPAAGS
jgi:hypothetical protein